MNISSNYSGIPSYPSPASAKAGTARPAARDISISETAVPVSLPATPVKEVVREATVSPHKKLSLSAATTQADQVRGRLASNDSPNASTQRALNAYQNIDVQQQREEVIKALGIDVYV